MVIFKTKEKSIGIFVLNYVLENTTFYSVIVFSERV